MSKQGIFAAFLMLAVGLGLGYYLSSNVRGDAGGDHSSASAGSQDKEREILFYRNPMNPDVTSPVPAKDSMGMDYVPVYADGGTSAGEVVGTVNIDSTVVQNIGVRTANAELGSLSRTIRAVGKIDFDEERMARIHPKVEGWIEELYVNKTGEDVSGSSILLSIYAPVLVSTQQEYLLALDNLEALQTSNFPDIKHGAEELLRGAAERLVLLDVPAHQIRELRESRQIKKTIHIHSPIKGTVIEIGAREGQYVTPGSQLYMISDLSKVWVYADIYEYEIPWVKVGDKVEMTLAGVPGKVFAGRLSYIYPYAEAKTRSIKVRLEFDNPDRSLRPDMFAEVSIHAEERDESIIIPAEAVVRSGVRNQVFVVRSEGKFEPREVELGLESGGKVIVLSGVEAGETVVTSAQFLIDSESKLREATSKMQDAASHEGHDMQDESEVQKLFLA
jgi:Cu(I)/Ag(I) efflux system membrane fusion protein